jgi:hypothetical protein
MGWRVLLAIAAMAVAVVGVGAGLALPQLGEAISASEAATLRGGKCYKDNPVNCDTKVSIKCTIDNVEIVCDVYNNLHDFINEGDKQPDGNSRYCCGTMPGADENCAPYYEKEGVACATTAVVVGDVVAP